MDGPRVALMIALAAFAVSACGQSSTSESEVVWSTPENSGHDRPARSSAPLESEPFATSESTVEFAEEQPTVDSQDPTEGLPPPAEAASVTSRLEPWTAWYSAAGAIHIRSHDGRAEDSFEVPATFEVVSDGASLFCLGVTEGGIPEENFGAGFEFYFEDEYQSHITRIDIIVPIENGTSTFGIILDEAVPWGNLLAGQSHTVTADGRRWGVTTTRSNSGSMWEIDVFLLEGKSGQPWFDNGTMGFVGDWNSQPWRKWRFEFRIEDSQGSATGDVIFIAS